MRAFFYDTWAFMALANTSDPGHAVSRDVDEFLEENGYAAATSDYIVDETLTGLHASGGAAVALKFADMVQARVDAQELLLLEVTAPRRVQALRLFRKIAPQAPRLSFTDCTSFAVMRELRIELAFTADRHFYRASQTIRPLIQRRDARLVFVPPG